MTRVLVTGGAGFIGSALCNRMADEGHRVTALDDCTRGEQCRLDKRVQFLKEDIRTPMEPASADVGEPGGSHLWHATKDCDAVWHLAARNGTRHFYEDPASVLDIQLSGTRNVIQRCVERGIRTLVLFSSSEVYQTPPIIPTPEDVPLSIPDIKNPRYSYAIGKIAAEAMAWHSPIERVVVIRPHNGPSMGYDHVIPQMTMRAARTPDGGTFEIRGMATRSFIYIDDFTDAMMVIWKNIEAREGKVREVYHVGTEEQVSTSALAGMISDICGRKITEGPHAGKWHYRFKSMPGPEGGTRARCPDTTKLRGIGWQAKIGLREGLERTVKAYMEKSEEWPA